MKALPQDSPQALAGSYPGTSEGAQEKNESRAGRPKRAHFGGTGIKQMIRDDRGQVESPASSLDPSLLGSRSFKLLKEEQAKINASGERAQVKSTCQRGKDRKSFARTQLKIHYHWANSQNKCLYLWRRGRKPSWADGLAQYQ